MLSRFWNAVSTRLARRKYAPDIEVDAHSGLRRLGSDYGGWTFEPSTDLEGATVVSCGLGEDASFDVAFAAAYHARLIIVDPTPRAITHFAEIRAHFGRPASIGYSKGGMQPVGAYDLNRIDENSLILEPSALWIENTRLRFYAPQDAARVSHSIVNLHGGGSNSSGFIEVPAITLESLMEKYHLGSIPLIKLDIEGAENKVIRHALDEGIFPRQLLVEFDEMNIPSQRSKENAEDTDAALRQAGYSCRYFDGLSNFLYIRI